MPSRIVAALIVLGWVSMAVWFGVRDAWPRLDPDEPPRITPDLVDEGGGLSGNAKDARMTNWVATRTSVDGVAHKYTWGTTIVYIGGSDAFLYKCEVINERSDIRGDSEYLVDREGHMRHLAVRTRCTDPARNDEFRIDVHERRATMTHTTYPDGHRVVKSVDLGGITLPHSGMIQLALHPILRTEVATPGRTWKVPFFDPLAPAFAGTEPTLLWLNARARTATEPLKIKQKTVSCIVIELNGPDVSGLIWQDPDNGETARQEWTIRGEKWVIQQMRDVGPQPRIPE